MANKYVHVELTKQGGEIVEVGEFDGQGMVALNFDNLTVVITDMFTRNSLDNLELMAIQLRKIARVNKGAMTKLRKGSG